MDGKLLIEFRPVVAETGLIGSELWRDGVRLAEPLFDHPGVTGGYRYVPVFHLAHAAVLGWSPNTDRLLAADGPRNEQHRAPGLAAEDAISVLELVYASWVGQEFGSNVLLDPELVQQILNLARQDVPQFTFADWERAAIAGAAAWRGLARGDCTHIELDFKARRLSERPG